MAQLAIIAFDGGFILAAFAVTAACGWWAVAPLRDAFGFPVLVAALAGMILLPFAALGISGVLGWPIWRSAPAAALVLCAASAAAWWGGHRPGPTATLAWSALAVAVATAIAMASLLPDELAAGEPAFAYMYGSDHLGYAHVADWLRTRGRAPGEDLDPTDPYPSYVALLFRWDPRFGSFALAALVGMASNRSGTFSYDLACAMVSAIGAAGLAGAFARARTTLLLLAVGLAISPLYDQAQNGYFAKLTGGFAVAIAARMVLAWCEAEGAGRLSLWGLIAAAILAAGAAVMHNAVFAGLLIASIGGAYIAVRMLRVSGQPWGSRLAANRNAAMAVGLAVAIAVLSSGVVARMAYIGGVRTYEIFSWNQLLGRAAGIESEVPYVHGMPERRMMRAAYGVFAAAATALALAIGYRASVAAAFILGPALVAVALATQGKWYFYQFGPLVPVLMLCGMVGLLEELAARRARWPWRVLAGCAAAAVLVLQVPRFAGAVRLYGFTALPELRFVRSEIDGLAAAIGSCGAYVDMLWHVHTKMFIVVELGWRGVPLQWSPEAWNLLLRYRRWPPPTYERIAPLRIMRRDTAPTGSELVARTRQFDLVRVPGAAPCAPTS